MATNLIIRQCRRKTPEVVEFFQATTESFKHAEGYPPWLKYDNGQTLFMRTGALMPCALPVYPYRLREWHKQTYIEEGTYLVAITYGILILTPSEFANRYEII